MDSGNSSVCARCQFQNKPSWKSSCVCVAISAISERDGFKLSLQKQPSAFVIISTKKVHYPRCFCFLSYGASDVTLSFAVNSCAKAMNNGAGVNSVGVAIAGAALGTSTTSKLQRRPSLKFRMSFRTKKNRQAMVERTCNELALEGERLCKEGRWAEGVERLESAARAGTQDLKTLSALYSQLGNAYFYLENYSKSLEYHKQDLTLARTLGDKLGEAKACGNIGSALKALGQFDESVACCRMQLDIAREISDKVSVVVSSGMRFPPCQPTH